MVKKNVEPAFSFDSTQIRPSWRSMIFLQMASPMPVPAYWLRLCKRRKTSKIRS